MSVRRAQKEINAREFTSWMAYFELDPFGNERMDFHAALISWTIASVMSTGTNRPKFQDYLFNFSQKKESKQSGQQIFDMMLAKTKAIGGKVVTPNA